MSEIEQIIYTIGPEWAYRIVGMGLMLPLLLIALFLMISFQDTGE